jgi:hypothetical protein
MCLLILHHRTIPDYPVVVGANRDEARDRPSEPPRLWPEGFLAPRDARAGGTWIGIAPSGLVVGITNRSRERPDPARPSRGRLVTEALAAGSARAAVARVERLGFAAPQNPANLLIADPRDAFLLVSSADGLMSRSLPPGTHVLTNEHELGEVDLGDLTPPPAIDLALERLAVLCRDHGEHGGYAVCKHGERFGTVSSALIAAGDGRPHRFLALEGLPCQHEYGELAPELAALAALSARG